MFGIGAQELVIIGLLALVVFGPGKLPQMARDLGGFVRKAQLSMDEFRSEFALWEGERATGHGQKPGRSGSSPELAKRDGAES